MAFVSPGETFQTFLGMDPMIQASKKALQSGGGGRTHLLLALAF